MLTKIKRRRRPIFVVMVLIIIAAVALVLFLPGKNKTSAEASVSDYTVATSDLKNVISGTGTLANEDAEDISIPAGITIEKVYIKSGDTVSEGDTLAKVDTGTVLTKIAEVQESITTLDSQIETARESISTTDTLTAGVSGRVKKIYAQTDKTVSAAISENGALMLISVDGLMAVDITTTDLAVGEAITVTLQDGTKMDGTVKSVSGETATVTLSDNGPEFGTTATVTDGDGNSIGTGTLYINSPISVTATDGTVASISVSENSSVSAGDTLLSLKGISSSAEYASLVSQRQSLADSLQELVKMSETGVITAQFSGVVSAVNVSAGDKTGSSSSSSSDSSSSSSNTAATGNNFTGVSTTDSTDITATQLSSAAGSDGSPLSPGNVEITQGQVSSLTITTPKALSTPQTGLNLTSAELAALPYAGTVTWSPSVAGTFAYGTSYTATLTLAAKSGYEFAEGIDFDISGGTLTKCSLSPDKTTLTIQVTFAATEQNTTTTPDTGNASSGSTTGSSTISGSSASTGSNSASGDTSSSSSNTSSDTSNSSDSVSAVEEAVILTVAPDENMVISVSVDELDILSLEAGQSAIVTLDAIENEIFTSTITNVDTTATSSGGVTTYTVDVEIPKTEDMLVGMNASITITIEEATGILVIPVDAVQEMGGRVFVYTEKDDDGNLSGQVDIETGISDGTYAEVTSGLSEGDTIYYAIVTSDDSGASNMTNFSFDASSGMGGMGNMGDMGDSGSMPSFDGSGNMPNRSASGGQ